MSIRTIKRNWRIRFRFNKKNHAHKSANENVISVNNSNANFTTIADEKQSRITEAEKFFNLLFGNVQEKKFGYLWAKQGDTKKTYPFDVSTPENRHHMAVKAIELSDMGADVYYGINLMDAPTATNARVTAELHGLCIYNAPITITADSRKLAEERNKKFLDVIRSNAGMYGKAVDSVGDLPRVLRVPGTRNYKLGITQRRA